MSDPLECRVLVLAPTARDAAATCGLLAAAGVAGVPCADIAAVCREAARGAGAAVLTAEAVLADAAGALPALLRDQPPWASLPLIVLTPAGPESPKLLHALEAVGPMTLVKRPVQVSALISTVRAAVRDRERQYAVRDLMEDRRRADAALREQERRAAAVLESMTEGFIVLDADWKFVYVNAAFERMTNVRRGEILGKSQWLVYPATVGTPVEAAYRRAAAERITVEFENHYEPWDRWFALKAYPAPDGGLCVQIREVSAVKQAEAAIARVGAESARRKRLYETVLSNTPDFMYVFSLDHTVLYANDALLTTWGVSAKAVVGKTFLEIGYEPWHADMHGREIDQVRATKKPIRGEVPFTGTNGRRIYDYIFVPVVGADGAVEAVAGTTRDVTDRKAAEEVLRDADRKKDDFIALLAHELRNPLAPVRNGLQVLRLSNDRATRERSQAMMDRQLGHMVRLIDDLLDVSRINRNKMELRRERILLADAVASAVETARPMIEAAGHELTVALPPEPVVLDADLTRLAQVFSNLLTNSAKYTEAGGTIRLAGRRDGDEIAVTVRDTGIGIPAEALPNIFDMFSQVDRSVERATGGLGIGLAIVKGLVEMHGGTVTAASGGQGQGSEFTVRLPVVPARPDPRPDAGPGLTAATAGPRRRILVVDDNRDAAVSMEMMLSLLGHEVSLAHDGVEAVERAAAVRPDVILMDVGMPRLNGLDATRRIREQPWGRAVKVIALTGWGQDADRARSKEAGCDGHLVKPVSLPDLQQLLTERG